MNLMIPMLLALNLGVFAWLLLRQRRLQQDLSQALNSAEQLGASLGMNLPPQTIDAPLISVAILNPMELAAKESELARRFGNLAPDLVRREVYKQIHQRLSKQLVEQGVVAEVTLHHAR